MEYANGRLSLKLKESLRAGFKIPSTVYLHVSVSFIPVLVA